MNTNEIKTACRALVAAEPRFAKIEAALGPAVPRHKPAGFEGLLQSIVSQQLSTKAASSIWARLVDAGLTTPEALVQATDAELRQRGLSHQKIRYSRALADADIDWDALHTLSTDEVVNTLVPIVGVGEWTAQMYALFALGHPDVFAPNDLGLQEGIRHLFALPERPTPKQADEYAKAWSPWRSVASLWLWAWYDHCRGWA